MSEINTSKHGRRDAETLLMLGAFIAILSIPVLIATFWGGVSTWRPVDIEFQDDTAELRSHAQIVNFLAGLVLLVIGSALAFTGWKRKKTLDEAAREG